MPVKNNVRSHILFICVLILCLSLSQCNGKVAAAMEELEAKDETSPKPSGPFHGIMAGIQYGLDDIGSKLEKIGGDAEQLVSSEWEKAISMKPFGSKLVHAAGKILADVVHGLEMDVREKIDLFIKTFHDVVSLAQGLHAIIARLTEKEGGMRMEDVSQELDVLSSGIIAHLQQAFPPPDQAPSHKERMEMTDVALVRFENGLLDLTSRLGLPEGEISAFRNTLDQLRPLVKDLVVTMGDLTEQHPVLFYVIIFATLGQLKVVPEDLIIRTLLRLFGFGLSGPVKGSPAAWAQKQFWGAAVEKGSWFSFMQKAGMTGISPKL